MKSKNQILILLVSSLIIALYSYYYYKKQPKGNKNTITIGILQSASHPALDQARDEFMRTMQSALKNNVEFVIRNAEGNAPNNHAIAYSFHSNDDIDGIFAIATPAAQAISAIEKEKPIFISAVTNYKELTPNNNNICGGSDKINIPATIMMIKKLAPHAKQISLLSYTGDSQSESEIIEIENELKKANLSPIRIGFTTETDVPGAILSACRKGDVILTPNYNIIASAMPMVSSIALENNTPLFACYPDAVKQGALAAHGIDYGVNGQQAAECALKVFINKQQPSNIPIIYQKGSVFINKKATQALNIIVPDDYQCTYYEL